jgi:polar amino acid transport system substrate-binding protein
MGCTMTTAALTFEQLQRIAQRLDSSVPGSFGHSRRVASGAADLARNLGLAGSEVARIRMAGALHDIGKIDLPAELINQPCELSDEEYELVKRHSAAGAAMISRAGDEEAARIVRHHHERFDGRGYPDGISGEEIPIGARVVAVVDSFDAMISTRPYRPARLRTQAIELLRMVSGSQLDPEAVEAFCGPRERGRGRGFGLSGPIASPA